jgi:hypothetical protein
MDPVSAFFRLAARIGDGFLQAALDAVGYHAATLLRPAD